MLGPKRGDGLYLQVLPRMGPSLPADRVRSDGALGGSEDGEGLSRAGTRDEGLGIRAEPRALVSSPLTPDP
jgi:hypothetical protein